MQTMKGGPNPSISAAALKHIKSPSSAILFADHYRSESSIEDAPPPEITESDNNAIQSLGSTTKNLASWAVLPSISQRQTLKKSTANSKELAMFSTLHVSKEPPSTARLAIVSASVTRVTIPFVENLVFAG